MNKDVSHGLFLDAYSPDTAFQTCRGTAFTIEYFSDATNRKIPKMAILADPREYSDLK